MVQRSKAKRKKHTIMLTVINDSVDNEMKHCYLPLEISCDKLHWSFSTRKENVIELYGSNDNDVFYLNLFNPNSVQPNVVKSRTTKETDLCII